MTIPYLLSLFHFRSLSSAADTVSGTADPDYIDGLAGNDSLSGLGGDDVLVGGAGNDSLSGDAGDDILVGGAGDDWLDGGAGFDLVSYETAGIGVRVSLADTASINTGGAGRDLLRNIEGVVGSIFNDRLEGNSTANLLIGHLGDDYILGGLGDDTLMGGLGNDVLNGEKGIDEASYADISAGVTVNLTTTSLQNTGSAGWDILLGIENLTGTSFADALTGSNDANQLSGGAGNDTLNGGSGSDTLIGGLGDDQYQVDSALDVVIEAENAGTDTVIARLSYVLSAQVENLTLAETASALNGTGNTLANTLLGNAYSNLLSGGDRDDTLWGGAGNDTLNGDAGNDTATYADAKTGLVLNLSLTTGQALGVLGTDVLDSIENLIAGSGNDQLTGSAAANRLEGGAGRDVLIGAAGDDTLDGGIGDDTLTGDAGHDSLLGGLGEDSLTGGTGNDLLDGAQGNDTLDGGAGDDGLYGGTGNDVLSAGAGNNIIAGGDGTDLLRYAQTLADATITWQAASGTFLIGTSTSQDVVSEVEQFDFAGTVYSASFLRATRLTAGNDSASASAQGDEIYGFGGNDSLTGGVGADGLYGGTGNDTLIGGGGNDLLLGDDGNDVIYAGAGNVTVRGGAGRDVLYLTDNFAQVTISFAAGVFTFTGPSGVVTASDIEEVYFGTDLVTNRLPPGISLSSVTGRVEEGNSGTREVVFTVTLDRAVQFDVTATYATTAPQAGGAVGADFDGGVLPSGTVTVAAGQTTASFSLWIAGDTLFELSEAFTVTLSGASGGAVLLAPAVTVTIDDDDIRQLTSGRDTASGTVMSDRIDGLAGEDQISGLDGNDVLWGGAGRDTLLGGAGDDLLFGGQGDDRLYGDAGTDTVSYANTSAGVNVNLKTTYAISLSDGTDRLYAIENVIGGSGSDTLVGASGVNVLTGGAGNDSLDGREGADILIGGTGDDTYTVDNLDDVVTELAEEGSDTVISTLNWVLGATLEHLQLAGTLSINGTGNALDNRITGNGRANALSGEAGNDTLTGGQGNDTLTGGDGSDRFVVDSGNDTILDLESNDVLILSSGAVADVSIVANFTATSATVLNGRSNLVVSEGVSANFAGAAGTKGVTLTAALNATASNLTGTRWADQLLGGGGADVLVGGEGNDSLAGGAGNDTMTGGLGNDMFNVTAGHDLVTDLSGGDMFFVATGASLRAVTTGDYTASAASVNRGAIEIVVGNGKNADFALMQGAFGITLNASANALASNLIGTARSDSILGGNGQDTLVGGAGDDTLVGNQSDSLFDGGADIDTLQLDADFTAASDGHLVRLEIVALTADGLVLDLSNQTEGLRMIGFDAGFSTLIGGSGNDVLSGGSGNDSIDGNGGVDTVSYANASAAVSVDLGQTTAQATGGAGTDILTGIEGVVGSDFADVLTGNDGNNVMGGGLGNDTISGLDGDDILAGGAGMDSLTGGAGADIFVFNNTPGVSNADTITDFDTTADALWLYKPAMSGLGAVDAALDPAAFLSQANPRTSADLTTAHRVLYDPTTGDLFYDADGSGATAATLLGNVGTGLALSADDFWIFG